MYTIEDNEHLKLEECQTWKLYRSFCTSFEPCVSSQNEKVCNLVPNARVQKAGLKVTCSQRETIAHISNSSASYK